MSSPNPPAPASSPLVRLFRAVARVFAFARTTLANLLVLFVVFVVVAGIVASATSERPQAPSGGALLIEPVGAIVEEQARPSPMTIATSGSFRQTTLRDLLDGVEKASEDERIASIVLDLSSLVSVAPAQLEVIGDAFEKFRESGKRIIAKGHHFGRNQYYLASFADEIYLHPFGDVTLGGYGMSGLYYRSLLDKLKVNMHVFRVGTHKAAVEPFTRDDMSEQTKESYQLLVDGVWQRYVERVAGNRNMEPEALVAYANRLDEFVAAADGDMAQAALRHGLVDALLEDHEVDKALREATGADEGKRYRRIELAEYLGPRIEPMFGDIVAVITGTGTVVMGDQPPGVIGADSLTQLLRDARKDDSVKAVVLRLDTGGGSALASELIRQQVVQVQEAGKPVVVSMGGTAASGGYWIAATADEIWASPTTLTGSIGIFAIVPTMENALQHVGISADGVRTGPFVDADDPTRGIGEGLARTLQASVNHGYRVFIELVARGRGMSVEEVDAIAQGQVWTGQQAHELGLVDRLGHLEGAVARAAELAGTENYRVRYMQQQQPPYLRLLQDLADGFGIASPDGQRYRGIATAMLRDLDRIARLNDPRHIYAICDACGMMP